MAREEDIEPITFRTGTAQHQAYLYLRERILSGDLASGERVNPVEIGDQLGISRMPVREALRQLDAEGLVTIRPNRGAIVTALTPDEVEELFEIRSVLEGLAGRLAAQRINAEDLDELEFLRARMDRTQSDAKLWIQRHNEFHDRLVRCSGRPRLMADITRIRNAMQPYLLMYIAVYNSTEIEGYEHQSLMDALQTGKPQKIESCISNHVMSAGRGVIKFLRTRAQTQV